MIPVLAALLIASEKRENKADCYKKISQWYWSAVFTISYSSAADTQMTAHYIDMNLWFDDDEQTPRVVLEARRDIGSLDLKGVQSSSSAIYKGILSLLALEGSNDFEKNQSLEFSPNNEKDHIFPKSVSVGFSKNKHIESVLNMTWLSKETNNRKRDKKPSVYIPDFVQAKYADNVEDFKKVLSTHLIDEKAFDYLAGDNFENFIDVNETKFVALFTKCDVENRKN
jgi:hypothetical protein